MSSPHSKPSLFAKVNRVKNSRAAWDLLGQPPPLAYRANPKLLSTHSQLVEIVDASSKTSYTQGTNTEEEAKQKTTKIDYKCTGGGVAASVIGAGYLYFEFKITSADGK